MLVDADTGGVDHHDLAVESSGYRRKQPVPNPGFAPADEPVVASRRGTVTLWYLSPRRPGAEPPENAVQNPSVINARNTAWLIGQQRFDNRPFPIRQFVSTPRHQASIAMKSLNHANRQTSRWFMSLRPKIPRHPRDVWCLHCGRLTSTTSIGNCPLPTQAQFQFVDLLCRSRSKITAVD